MTRNGRGGSAGGNAGRKDALSLVVVGRQLTGHEVDHLSGDRHSVIGKPLVVTTDEGHVDRTLDALIPTATENRAEHLAVQIVHHVVVAVDLGCGDDVAGGDDTAGL